MHTPAWPPSAARAKLFSLEYEAVARPLLHEVGKVSGEAERDRGTESRNASPTVRSSGRASLPAASAKSRIARPSPPKRSSTRSCSPHPIRRLRRHLPRFAEKEGRRRRSVDRSQPVRPDGRAAPRCGRRTDSPAVLSRPAATASAIQGKVMRLASESRTTSASIRASRPSGASPAALSAGLPISTRRR